MIDLALILVSVLLTITAAAALEYYKQLAKIRKEYEKARSAVEDIVVSFNHELQREVEKTQAMEFKLEGGLRRSDADVKKVEALEQRFGPIEGAFEKFSQNIEKVAVKVTSSEGRLRGVEEFQELAKAKIKALEEQLQNVTILPEKTEVASSVMPIRREKALAALTDTELAVLEFILTEGAKTAPEIKEKVKLSREHTSRLMKKLYEGGYLERETGKLPFTYSVKDEVEKLLRKPTAT